MQRRSLVRMHTSLTTSKGFSLTSRRHLEMRYRLFFLLNRFEFFRLASLLFHSPDPNPVSEKALFVPIAENSVSPISFHFAHRPLCRTVADCLYMFDAMAFDDPAEPVHSGAVPWLPPYTRPEGGYLPYLKKDGLAGALMIVEICYQCFEVMRLNAEILKAELRTLFLKRFRPSRWKRAGLFLASSCPACIMMTSHR